MTSVKRAEAAFLATLATLLVVASVARAEDVTATPVAQRGLAIAAQYWGVSIPGYAVRTEAVEHTEEGEVAQALEPGNWMKIDPTFWNTGGARMVCVIIVHEYGHSTGHDHVADPGSVMFWQPAEDSVPGCSSSYPSLEEVAEHKAEAETRAMFARQDARRRHRHHRTGRNHR